VGNEFEERVVQQIEELVRARVSPLEQDLSRLQREVNQAFTTLLERTDAAAAIPNDESTLAKIAAGIQAEMGRVGAQGVRLSSDLASLREAVDHLGRQTTQAEVLNALIERASTFAPRLLLFVVKGENALGWAAGGTEEPLEKSAVRSIAISLELDTVLKAALDSQKTFYGSADEQSENHVVTGKLGTATPARVLAVPLKVRGKSAAVLYADSSDRGAESINIEAIDLLVCTTGFVVELTSLRTRVGDNASATAAATPARPPTPPPAAKTPASEPRVSGPLPGQSGPLPAAPRSQPVVEAKQAAPAFFKPAAEPHQPVYQAPDLHPPAPAPRAPEPVAARPAEPARSAPLRSPGSGDQEEEQHNNARRFARLLVSEIKLYNEQKVVEGRHNNDLYDRLKEDIDRSRQMYDKRIPPTVTSRFDYFYDELVNTLAEGDPGKLGSDYPGPAVRV
jgi:hypothetical protein